LRGFRLRLFYEKWSYLPGCPAKLAAPRQKLPSPDCCPATIAGPHFPRGVKIDV
jgi:hypothetical protein